MNFVYNIVILGIVSFLTDISTEMVYPLLPIFLTTTLGASPAIIGIIEGIAESLASLLKVFSGYLGDKTTRKKELAIAGYGSSMVGKVILALATSWGVVLTARVADRLGKGIRTAPRDALIAEAADADKRGRAFGLHRTMDTLGAAVGVGIAYLFLARGSSDYRLIFLLSLIPALGGVITLFLVRQERPIKETGRKLSFNWSSLDSKLKTFLVFSFIFTLGNSSNQFLLLRASNLGVSSTDVVLMYLMYNLSYAALSYPAARFSDKVGRKRVLVAGYILYALVYLGFARVTDTTALWGLFIIYGGYIAFTEGVAKALLVDISPTNLRGTVIGLQAALVGIALLPASLIAGALWEIFGPSASFYFGSGMGLLAATGLFYILREKRERQPV